MLGFTAGTTLARMAPLIDCGSKPCRCMSWVNQAAYSSAVRLASVRRRNCDTSLSPSNTANFELVLPTSMASSIARSPLGRPAQQLAGHDLARAGRRIQQQSALAVQAGEATTHQLLAELHVNLEAERTGLGEPCRPHRFEAVAPPLGKALGQRRGEPFQRSLDRAAERGARIAHLRELRREADIDADANHDVLDLAALPDRALGQDAGDLAAANEHVVRPLQAHVAACRHDVGDSEGCNEPELGRTRSVTGRPQDGRRVEIADRRDPVAAAPAAPARLLARPDDGALR